MIRHTVFKNCKERMTKIHRIKRLPDGRSMLNLGCGFRMHWDWNNLDFFPSAILAHYRKFAWVLRKIGFLSEERYKRLLKVDPRIIHWNLKKGIPFSDESFDVVYHSHLLEHLDKDFALTFLRECYRVLKTGGIIRVVVPDLEVLVNRYVSAISKLERGDRLAEKDHIEAIDNLFEPMVRKESVETQKQKPLIRIIERVLKGNISKTGELHRWMYDKYSLETILSSVGLRTSRRRVLLQAEYTVGTFLS